MINFNPFFQCTNLKEKIEKMRESLMKKDEIDPEELRKQTNELQQASLKLFEMAYKKVCKIKYFKIFIFKILY